MPTRVVLCCFGCITFVTSASVGLSADYGELQRIVTEHYSDEFLSRAANYHAVRRGLFFVQSSIVLVFLGFLAASPLGRLGQCALSITRGNVWLGRLLVITVFFLGLVFIRLPFSFIRFAYARSYGLRHDSITEFFFDYSKTIGISWVIVVVVGLIILGLFAALPRWWWVLSTCIVGRSRYRGEKTSRPD